MSNGLAEQGFLSPEISLVISVVAERYAPWFGIVRKINGFAVDAQHKIEVHKSILQELLVATLFARTLSNVQGAILLTERGMEIQARILLRAAMDSLFRLMAIARSPEVGDEFVAADELERKRMLNKARRWSAPTLKAQVTDSANDEKLAEIEAAIQEKGAKVISSEEMSKKAGLHDWYLTAYSVFSASVHSGVRDLEQHLVVGANGELESLSNEATIDGLDRLLLSAAEIMLTALGALGEVFNFPVDQFREEHFATLGALANTIKG